MHNNQNRKVKEIWPVRFDAELTEVMKREINFLAARTSLGLSCIAVSLR